ncbi:amino acid ABC transporter permease [Treponema primitia]|uniref:amino acid ABC transporter permease n=1 Tax=Treponema primitia TaxID=88058 RepID=UPI003980CA98
MFKFDWSYVIDYIPKILQALPLTLLIVVSASVSGLLLGAVWAIFRIERIPVLGRLSAVFVSFVRGTPIFIQMFVIYYGLPLALLAFGINIMRVEKLIFVLIAYGVNSGAFFSEIIRSSVQSVPREQWDAAFSVGHSKLQTWLRIIIPQSIVIAIPSTGVMIIGLLEDTTLAFVMGIIEVVGKAQSLGKHTMHTLEAYFVVAVLFIMLSFLIERAFLHLARKTRTQGAI